MEKQIILNRVQCKNCGDVLISHHRHDYKRCSCENETMVDGGNSYLRYGGIDISLVDNSSTIYLSDDHMMNRSAAHWGNRGKDGMSQLTYVSVENMSNDHIDNIIKYMGGNITPYMENILKDEIEYRKLNNIKIDD